MKFATVFVFALFAFVAQAHPNHWEKSTDNDFLKWDVIKADEILQDSINKGTHVVKIQIKKAAGDVKDNLIMVSQNYLDKVGALEDKLAKQLKFGGHANLDGLKSVVAKARNSVADLMSKEIEILNAQIEKAAGKLNAQVLVAGQWILDEVHEIESDNLHIHGKKDW